eukprot:364557-Chlamydomonas_euryale.AAC.12
MHIKKRAQETTGGAPDATSLRVSCVVKAYPNALQLNRTHLCSRKKEWQRKCTGDECQQHQQHAWWCRCIPHTARDDIAYGIHRAHPINSPAEKGTLRQSLHQHQAAKHATVAQRELRARELTTPNNSCAERVARPRINNRQQQLRIAQSHIDMDGADDRSENTCRTDPATAAMPSAAFKR